MANFKVDIKLLKTLREKTGISFSVCRDALVEANNDFDRAVEILKIKNLVKAVAKSTNQTSEGLVDIKVEKNHCVIIELDCQTDFVARNFDFKTFLSQISQKLVAVPTVTTIDQVLDLSINGETIKSLINKNITKLGENIILKRFQIIEKQTDEIFGFYVHSDAKSAGLVVLSGTKDETLAKDIAMQLVAMQPKFIDVSEISETEKNAEKAIAKEQVTAQIKDSNKPKDIIEKMILGKYNKALAELTIVNQKFIKDSGITIQQYLDKNHAKIKKMISYHIVKN